MTSQDFYSYHFGQRRLEHYRSRCGRDETQARALYDWNVKASAAMWEVLSYFEVAFRNALDRRLTERHTKKGRAGDWLFDDAYELGRHSSDDFRKHRQPFKDISTAMYRVRQNKKKVDSGQVISEISFGFWHQMVSQKQMFLWPDLAGAFPHAPNRVQATIQDPVSRLRDIRNRIGHHHRIWSEDVYGRHADLLAVSRYIDPSLEQFIASQSRVPTLLADCPVGTLIASAGES